jgi:hemerythrin-like domain-containing protein
MAKQRTEAFRKQHGEVLKLVEEMSANMDVGALERDAAAIRRLLSALAAKLTMHLAMEDKVLYPQMLQHPKHEIQKLARAYSKEMGGITDAFTAYLARWPSPETIQHAAAEFVRETNAIFKALRKRIEKEDSELYPLVDKEG